MTILLCWSEPRLEAPVLLAPLLADVPTVGVPPAGGVQGHVPHTHHHSPATCRLSRYLYYLSTLPADISGYLITIYICTAFRYIYLDLHCLCPRCRCRCPSCPRHSGTPPPRRRTCCWRRLRILSAEPRCSAGHWTSEIFTRLELIF